MRARHDALAAEECEICFSRKRLWRRRPMALKQEPCRQYFRRDDERIDLRLRHDSMMMPPRH